MKVRKAEAADNWVILTFPNRYLTLLSWDAQACGVALADPDEKKALLAAARQTPTILSALKKHVVGSELTQIRQLRRDKLLELTFRRAVSADVSVTRHLILEAMDRYSNLILTDESHTIIEAAKHIHPAENRFRAILPGFPYTPPPEFKGMAIEEWLRSPESSTITKIAGFGKPFLNALETVGAEQTARTLSQYYDNVEPSCQAVFQSQIIGKYVTFSPPIPTIEGVKLIGADIAAAGNETTLWPLLNRDLKSRKKRTEGHINREILRRERQCNDIGGLLAKDSEVFRKEAELVIANLHLIEPGAQSSELNGWDEHGVPVTAIVKLNPAISPQRNAAMLFNKYKKTAAAQKRAAKLLEKVQQELLDLREQLSMVSLAEDSASLAAIEEEMGMRATKTKHAKKSRGESYPLPPHKRFDLGFALVFAGLSAGGNRYVTFNLASPDDLWFHVQGVPGAHVILRFYGDTDDERAEGALKFCASLAVWYSKARESGRARVDFTYKKYVSPIKGSLAGVTYKEFESVTEYGNFWKSYFKNLSDNQEDALEERC